jgi:6-phospho-3-hexuloisomerase
MDVSPLKLSAADFYVIALSARRSQIMLPLKQLSTLEGHRMTALEGKQALKEVAAVMDQLVAHASDALTQAFVVAHRIALHGMGREGRQMKGLAMRLFHLGLDAHVVGEMTTPPLGKGDLLFVSSGPGESATTSVLLDRARRAGAHTALVTSQPGSALAGSVDHVLYIPAQTMADDQGKKTSILPMGSLFEVSQMLVFELLAFRLRELKGETAESMRARHTNFE